MSQTEALSGTLSPVEMRKASGLTLFPRNLSCCDQDNAVPPSQARQHPHGTAPSMQHQWIFCSCLESWLSRTINMFYLHGSQNSAYLEGNLSGELTTQPMEWFFNSCRYTIKQKYLASETCFWHFALYYEKSQEGMNNGKYIYAPAKAFCWLIQPIEHDTIGNCRWQPKLDLTL